MTELPDLKERLEHERDAFHMADRSFDDLRRRRSRRQTRRRVSAGLVAFAAVAGASLLVGTVFVGASRTPLNRPTTPPSAGRVMFGPQVPVTYLNGVKDMDFVDATHGWIVEARWILATSDGGRTWVRQAELPPSWLDLTQVDFVDSLHGWALAPSGLAGEIGAGRRELLRTVDGGRHWIPAGAPPPGVPLERIQFLNPDVGFGVAVADLAGSSIYRTTDGGVTWRNVDPSIVNAGPSERSTLASIGSICFTSSNDGWAATSAYFPARWTRRHGPQNYPGVLRTTDGGHSWRVWYALEASERVQDAYVTGEVKCAGDTAYALFKEGGESYAVVRIFDGSASTWPVSTWTPILAEGRLAPSSWPDLPIFASPTGGVPGPFFVFEARSATFLSTCVQCGAGVIDMTSTNDGGGRFVTQPIHGFPPLGAVSLTDPMHGWVVVHRSQGGSEQLIAIAGAEWRQIFPVP
jgi:hypothetical protein